MIYSTHDNFLTGYDLLRSHANTCEFSDIENPTDSVVYPNICTDIPQIIKNEVVAELSKAMRRMVKINIMFMRYSPKDVSVPHMAHHDLSEGAYSLMLYLNDHPEGGTSFVRHAATGVCYAPQNQKMVGILRRDQNNPKAWIRTVPVEMKQNRALIFDAGFFHVAEPIGGFGDNQKDGRIVLTAFFS